MVHHMVMARRQVLVQLDDDLVERLDEVATRTGRSRSALLRDAAEAVLAVAADDDADEALVDAYTSAPPDPDLLSAARRLAASTGDRW